MNIFFLIPFLLVAGFGIYQDASALETITGYDYFDIDNGDGTRTYKTHYPYVFDGVNWVPFVASGTSITTHIDTVTLNADGSYSWTDKKVTDRIVAKYADVSDLNTWTYPNTLNNDTPDISWNGTALISSKVKTGVGKLDYIYKFENGKWKTQLEATNLSILTTKAFGFDQIFDIQSDTIQFGGVTRNLNNFDGVTFDKEFLDANKAKVLNLINGLNYDFDLGYENLYSITVHDTGVNKSQLVFDFRTSTPLLPGKTLIIDPTYNSAISAEGSVYGSTGTGSCETRTGDTVPGSVTVTKKNTATNCQIYWAEFDITTIPVGSIATSAYFEYDQTATSNWNEACTLRSYTGQPSGLSTANKYSQGWGGTALGSVTCTTDGNDRQITLNATGLTDLNAKIASGGGWWAASLQAATPSVDATQREFVVTSSQTRLNVVYTLVPRPDSITTLAASSVGVTTASLTFTAPNLNGESLINYMLNVTTPQQDTPPSTFWMNGSSSPFAVTGLTQGTDYSASASAYTVNGGNWTLANVLNFTTSLNPIACCAPTSLTASSNSATQIDLQWVASTLDNLRGYRIERETPIGTGFNVIIANTSSTNVYYNNTGLTTNIIYNYRVYGINGSGQSLASNTYDMTAFHLPDAVDDLTGTATDLSTIDLSWSTPTSYAPEIEGYMINGTTPEGEPVDILNANTGTTATTATALNLLIGQEYSFRVSPITVHGMNASGNIWNGSTVQTFVIGDLSNPDITNNDDFSIFFERTDLNSSAIQLDVTYPNSYNLSCDFDYKYARTNQTYSSLTTVPDGADDQTATFTLINATGELVQVRCWDPATGDESVYVITITDFPFLEQVRSLRDGDYGTYFQIGAFDGVMLIVIFLGMIGLNKTTPIVGIIFVVITTLAFSYFEFITYPIVMYPALIMMIVWAFITTRKDD